MIKQLFKKAIKKIANKFRSLKTTALLGILAGLLLQSINSRREWQWVGTFMLTGASLLFCVSVLFSLLQSIQKARRTTFKTIKTPTSKLKAIQCEYPHKIERIKDYVKEHGVIKVGFILVFNSVFPVRPIFEMMLKNSRFDPYIIVAPDISRNQDHQTSIYYEALTALSELYPNRVIGGFNEETYTYVELNDEFKIIFFCNPYDSQVYRFHSLEYFLNKDVLGVYVNYGFEVVKYWKDLIQGDFFNKIWKVCIETPQNMQFLKRHSRIHGQNSFLSGYVKMDKLAHIIPQQRVRKRILICPHHTVWGWEKLNLGNFLRFSTFFLELPLLYPDIDFVFRPHPLLFLNLLQHKLWSKEMIKEYIQKIESYPNCVYDTVGEYFDLFVNSDALIHDCGSFMAEYLYTEKPCCFMMKSEEALMKQLLPFGKECIQHYYTAFECEDIVTFINDVVIHQKDHLKLARTEFAKKKLRINYPHSTEKIIHMLEIELDIR